MKLHIFNPEHDIALAANLSNFTAPHAGRALRADLGFLPAIWAEEGDAVLVDDIDDTKRRWADCLIRNGLHFPEPTWVTLRDLHVLHPEQVDPWGWDLALRAQLLRNGIMEDLLPTIDEIEEIRHLSHRQKAAGILQELQKIQGTTGEAFCCLSVDEIEEKWNRYHRIVLKAPWSSSGRGVRFMEDTWNMPLQRWAEHVIQTQGSIMVEPYYDKVEDFAMEFFSDGLGQVNYQGLSVFRTTHGAYTGNVLATEADKQQMMSRYIPVSVLLEVQDCLCKLTASLFQHQYAGPFGIDMMVVRDSVNGGYLLHPCVEINVRRTMGHVALALAKRETGPQRLMRVALSGRYELDVEIDDNEEHHYCYDAK